MYYHPVQCSFHYGTLGGGVCVRMRCESEHERYHEKEPHTLCCTGMWLMAAGGAGVTERVGEDGL